MIQFSIFSDTNVLIPIRKRLLGAGRIRCAESGTPSTKISVRGAAVGIADLRVMFLWREQQLYPTDSVGCNYLSLPLMPASGI